MRNVRNECYAYGEAWEHYILRNICLAFIRKFNVARHLDLFQLLLYVYCIVIIIIIISKDKNV